MADEETPEVAEEDEPPVLTGMTPTEPVFAEVDPSEHIGPPEKTEAEKNEIGVSVVVSCVTGHVYDVPDFHNDFREVAARANADDKAAAEADYAEFHDRMTAPTDEGKKGS